MTKFTLPFSEVSIKDIPRVGGKNASLGEMFSNLASEGISVPDGFAITSAAYIELLTFNNVRSEIRSILGELDTEDYSNLQFVGDKIRSVLLGCKLPPDVKESVIIAYRELCSKYQSPIQVAVRSSATAEDLPNASFAGQQESYLNIRSEEELLDICIQCYASLFTNRAIKYRNDNGFDHMEVYLSIGVQKMVRSDKGCAGVAFTIDPETGFDNIIHIAGSWGLGEYVVKGEVNPDEFIAFKPGIGKGLRSIISKKLGDKSKTLIYGNDDEEPTKNIETSDEKRRTFVLNDEELERLALWSHKIETYYKRPMDIEWAKDGVSGDLFIVQARPETVHANKSDQFEFKEYKLIEKGNVLTTGKNVGSSIASGKARILHSPDEIDQLQKGEVLVTTITNPDWDPVLKKAAAVVTDRGGRTSHAAIVARESGTVAVVGCSNATTVIEDGQEITVSCIDGKKGVIYDGLLDWEEQTIDTRNIHLPQTEVMFILADPDQAFKFSFLPNNGVGLLRMEFAINNTIKMHPLALVHYDEVEDLNIREKIDELTMNYSSKEEYFVDQLSQAVSTIASAFYPKDVIVRMSDFKSNEYAKLIGGEQFEPHEENPMLGWRGASRYYSEGYKEGFRLECEAMKRVRNEHGLTNVKLMIPFCRTVEEGRKVIELMEEFGLKRGENQLEIYMMTEIPNNVILAAEFAKYFDGFSIGSNDLTQLTLGVGRDSEILADLFDVNDQGVKKMISMVIASAKKTNTKIGLCGQAPSDFPEFAKFLVDEGIDSISFNPDALIKGIENIIQVEAK
jgi:pyruvate,water dikinase